ncbi:MAG: hypothetical protein C5B59_18440 [Bacteroidetes bacterium]|nr:MAG: hypothetical protein C5B59_18440 [Bacteroidota bacterium]
MTYEVVESQSEEIQFENILIKGDNLLALNAIKKIFDNKLESEKVKCIYIDPPFNTGQAFDYYDDNLERSEWLTMLRDRTVILKSLLREDGFFIVHLDDSEVHYCKVLMDEVMGSSNFISHVTYERSGVAGLGQGGFLVNTTEHILLYRNVLPPLGNNVGSYALDENTIRRYNRILNNTGDSTLVEEFISKSNKKPVKIFKHSNFEIETISLSNFKEREAEIRRIYAKNLNFLFRGNQVQKENSFQNDLIDKMEKDCLYSVIYTPSRGRFKDEETTLYYFNKELLSWLGDNAVVDGDDIVKSLKLTTLWDHEDIPKADIANEGGVDFPRGKKPENLLKRIFDLCTNEGDLILDCFAGSGTSLAVAHKMNRKWIGVEIGNHADTHIIPRLKNVLSGSDQLGISKKVNWKGGGSFKYYHLGSSIIKIQKDTSGDFNWSLGKHFIEESLLHSYDYILDTTIDLSADNLFSNKEELPVVGVQRIGSRNRVAIVSLNEPEGNLGNLAYEELQALYIAVKKKYAPEYINIFTNRGIEIAFDSKPDDLEVVKVPHAIFAELEK